MALTNARIPYRTIRDGILKLLRDNKSTLNSSLTLGTFTQNIQIRAGDPDKFDIKSAIYPTILVSITADDEDFLTTGGAGARKRYETEFIIYGLVKVEKLSIEAQNDIMTLATNIGAIFRDNVDINTNCYYSKLGRKSFDSTPKTEQGMYMDIVGIELKTVSEVK